jgi:hypothetical protein
MLCQQTLFILAAFLTTVIHSLPSPPPEAEGGNITWYGDQTPAKRSFDLNRRQCGRLSTVTCSSRNIYLAYQSDCAGLQSVLSGQPYNGTVTRDIRSVCYLAGGQGSRQCCVSITIPILDVVDADFLNSVIALNNQCWDGKFGVAGIISHTTIRSGCNNVCLSNHWNKCQWLYLPEWK